MPCVHHRRKAGCSLRPKQCHMSAPIAAAGRERTIVAHNFVGVPGAKKLRRRSAITGKSGFDLHEVVATTTPLKLSCRKTSSTVGPNSAALVAGHLARGRTHGAGVPVVTDEVRFCAGFRTPARRALHALMRPASEKRQGTKSRWVGHPAGQRALWGFGRVVRARAI